MARAKMEFKVTNINKRGEVFDPSTVTIHAGDLPDFDIAVRALAENINKALRGY